MYYTSVEKRIPGKIVVRDPKSGSTVEVTVSEQDADHRNAITQRLLDDTESISFTVSNVVRDLDPCDTVSEEDVLATIYGLEGTVEAIPSGSVLDGKTLKFSFSHYDMSVKLVMYNLEKEVADQFLSTLKHNHPSDPVTCFSMFKVVVDHGVIRA